ncbi:MAG: hypothetical protein R2710_06100 [Acidimicrobiales bacterium]
MSSLAALAVDFGVLFATMALTHRLLLSVVAARTISACSTSSATFATSSRPR